MKVRVTASIVAEGRAARSVEATTAAVGAYTLGLLLVLGLPKSQSVTTTRDNESCREKERERVSV